MAIVFSIPIQAKRGHVGSTLLGFGEPAESVLEIFQLGHHIRRRRFGPKDLVAFLAKDRFVHRVVDAHIALNAVAVLDLYADQLFAREAISDYADALQSLLVGVINGRADRAGDGVADVDIVLFESRVVHEQHNDGRRF